MTGQPTPDPPTRDDLRRAIGFYSGDVAVQRLLDALDGCAVIDGTPRRLEAMGDDGGWENCYTASGGVGG